MSTEIREHPKRSADDKKAFKRELEGVVPHLRAFARGLCGRPDMADDLVQETLLKAWAAQDRFEPGTSMRAWTFVILRNAYLTDMRRNRFRGEYDETAAERILTAPAGQHSSAFSVGLQRLTSGLAPYPVLGRCHGVRCRPARSIRVVNRRTRRCRCCGRSSATSCGSTSS